MNYKAVLAYDGTAYAGWQRQLKQPTIQAEIELVLGALNGSAVVAHSAGRTDAGVHAAGQVISFRLDREWVPARLRRALNGNLPADIRILTVEPVADDFHPRFNTHRKTYRYQVVTAPVMSPFLRRYALHYPFELDHQRLASHAAQLVGRHDFRGFTVTDCEATTSVRTVTAVELRQDGEVIAIDITGNGFLRYQVRTMVAALLELNGDRHRRYAARGIYSMAALIDAGERSLIGSTAPAHGLTLMKVEY
ncbi:MAG: tRNA pseudouridine(38-40) synthase TruA [Acidobacteriota bacterium]|jgi:tRNA pseudouridine38-40 synthase